MFRRLFVRLAVPGALAAAAVFTMLALQPTWLNRPRAATYALARQFRLAQLTSQLSNYALKTSEHFTLASAPADADVADIVLEEAERVRSFVTEAVGADLEDVTVLVLYPDRESLRRAFGWPDDRSAVGVYWGGAIRLLSPRVWIDTGGDPARLRAEYQRSGPLTHELTHLALDLRTNGNYPRWFSEGLAQVVEEQVTGYLWIEADASDTGAWYTLGQLSRDFDGLRDQALAYRQSYLMVRFLADVLSGRGSDLRQVIDALAAGRSFSDVLKSTVGLSPAEFEARWRAANSAEEVQIP